MGRVRSRDGSETEKALAELFDTAEREGWTLVFDEADTLFTRRPEVADAHDRFADLEVNLLLQRNEELSKSMVTRLPDVQQNPGLAAFAVRRFPTALSGGVRGPIASLRNGPARCQPEPERPGHTEPWPLT